MAGEPGSAKCIGKVFDAAGASKRGSFHCQLPFGCDPHMLMETAPKPRASRATRQAATVALGVPGEEFVQAEVVNPFRDWRGDAVQHQGLQAAPICALVYYG